MEPKAHDFRTVFCVHCGTPITFPVKCRERFCSLCAPYRASRARKRIRWLLEQKPLSHGARLRLITLTVKSEYDVQRQLQHLLSSFRRLRARTAWKTAVDGGIYVVEITRSERGWHCHLHIIAAGRFYPQHQLSKLWNNVSNSPIVDIRLIRSRAAVSYVCKYVTTPSVADRDVTVVSKALANLRLWSAFGTFHGLNRTYKPAAYHCPSCGNSDWISSRNLNSGYAVDHLGPPT